MEKKEKRIELANGHTQNELLQKSGSLWELRTRILTVVVCLCKCNTVLLYGRK